MVLLMWITVVLFSHTDSAQTNIINQPNSVITAASGDNVTLHCFRMEEGNTDAIIWYKQAVGHEPRPMVTVQKVLTNPVFVDDFKSPKFTVENLKEKCNLKITNVDPSDEAMYYCGLKKIMITFGKGTFLAVKDDGDVKVSVIQSGVLDSVPAGASVTLQCSVLSESRAAEHQVLWFRAASPQSHPQIIYTHHNSSRQCESVSSTHTCVYDFSKNILSISDTGTYYCAVAVCGKIIFGNGTQVQLVESVDPVVICLAVALGVCAVVNSVQALLLCKWRNREQLIKRKRTGRRMENNSTQDHDSLELNYAALQFNEKKTKGGREKRKQSQPQASVYSEVRSLATN
ncbi:uncharacterized protein LOC132890030 [Neoarius graeffei]|uniref:uncharacterized protein LOC132890030 n=1 Tax=Neoarius graeffei TaxID=443677 RepID=UPI00298BD65E|nr:uncharacterized protein LOC132890030 [Neoarius graeffei]